MSFESREVGARALDGALLPPQTPLARAFMRYGLMYGLVSANLTVLARFLLPGVPHDFWLLVAAFALAWIVGFVTPDAPAGLGVREDSLLLMLASMYSTATVSILVIAMRITMALGDVLNLIVVFLLRPRTTKKTLSDAASRP